MQPTPPSRHPRKAGIRQREAIRKAISARINAGEPCPTHEELASYLHMNRQTLRHHLRWMIEQGELEVQESVREVKRRELCLVVPPAEPEP